MGDTMSPLVYLRSAKLHTKSAIDTLSATLRTLANVVIPVELKCFVLQSYVYIITNPRIWVQNITYMIINQYLFHHGTQQNDILHGAVVRVGGHGLNLFHHLHTVDDMAENGVCAVEMR